MQRANPAQRRYVWRFLPAMLGYSVVLLFAQHAIRDWRPTGLLLVILAAAPAIPLIAAVVVMGLYLAEERDEYIRANTVSAMLAATGLLLASATMWGFLEESGVVSHQPAWVAFPLWAIFLGLSQGSIALRNRLGNGA